MIRIDYSTEETVQDPNGGDITQTISDTIWIDGATNENFTFPAKITTYPIEQGAPNVDHARPDQKTFSLDCVVSNNPVSDILLRDSPPEGGFRSEYVIERINYLIANSIPVTIETPTHFYENYMIGNLSETKQAKTGEGIEFTLRFVELIYADIQVTDAPSPRVERGRRATDGGRNTGTGERNIAGAGVDPVTDQTTARGLLNDLASVARDSFGGGGPQTRGTGFGG